MVAGAFGGPAPATIESAGKTYIRGDDAGGGAIGSLVKSAVSAFSWGFGVGGVNGSTGGWRIATFSRTSS